MKIQELSEAWEEDRFKGTPGRFMSDKDQSVFKLRGG